MALRVLPGLIVLLWLSHVGVIRADSVVVFNEIMYHPLTNEPAMEWVELHNQLAVPVDMSGWSLDGAITYTFPEGTMIAGGGYQVIAYSPADVRTAFGLTNVLGPFTGRLGNNGDTLRLYNNSHRLMDEVNYGVEGDWPVGPDGSGVSLAKGDETTASGPSRNWTVSALVEGTPGQRNFALKPYETSNSIPATISSAWKYNASGNDPGSTWSQTEYDDSSWNSGQGLFQVGTITPPQTEMQTVPTVYSTGVGADGAVLTPGSADPHYLLSKLAGSYIPATVVQNHPAWLANDGISSWIGPINPGSANAPAGTYNYRTTFTFNGYDLASAILRMNLSVDNSLTDVRLNGSSRGITFAGFNAWSSEYVINTGILAGNNTLDFYTVNEGTGDNPVGFRVKLTGTARRQFASQTSLPTGRTTYYFRTKFQLDTLPHLADVRVKTVIADGAVFYLNGTEVYRFNMPAGPITASTLASSNIVNPAYLGPFLLSNSALRTGTNVLAIELHQGQAGLTNALFGADLYLTTTNILVPPPVTLALNEFSSATNANFWIELFNYGASNVNLGGCVLARKGGATNREYVLPAQALAPGAFLQLTKATLGFGADPGDRLFLYSAGRASVLDAVVAKRTPRARTPDGLGQWWHPTTLTAAASNHFDFHDEVVINEIMYHPPGLPPFAGDYGTNLFINITNLWRYNSGGQDLGTNWREPMYNDNSWPAGRALFYNSGLSLPAPKNTALTLSTNGSYIRTWYFRAPFVFNGEPTGAQLYLHPVVDAGAVFYLNGSEVYRQNLPEGAIQYTNFASTAVSGGAKYTSPILISADALVPGTNMLAVEVHRYLTNNLVYAHMAFGTELYQIGELLPALPARESAESWLELFNRSANPVDLTGWQLSHDIDYTFPAGTMLPAGGYLVVAKDVGFMQTNYPGLDVLGPFANKLRHSSSHILLLDPAGNPADEIRYYDRKPWPGYADGGGSSLELRDPWADNAKAEAWADSLESGRSTWAWYTNRMTSVNGLGPVQWNEFVMGLLDEGECLIDDLHVVESPAGTPVEFLQNGDFESGLNAWRALGTHGRSVVEVDPDNPGNHVLHLVTSGPTEHMHNHMETTYTSGRTVTDGREYLVRFRAKWLAGNNRLNTRLYFNRVSKTFELPMPTQHGTPGARNSTYSTNMGPTFARLSHSPVIPLSTDTVTVRVSASDPQVVNAIALRWSVNGGAWNSASMTMTGPSTEPGYTDYAAILPSQAAGTVVQFYVEASDSLGAVSFFPPGGSNSRALYKVDEGKGLMTQLHRFRLWMTPADVNLLHASTNVMSNYRLGLTAVRNEREVYYDIGVHLQGSERGRDTSSRVGFTLKFHADQLYCGVHDGLAMDRSGGYSGRGGTHDEILVWHALNHAGAIPGMYNDLMQVQAPRASEDGTAMVRLASYGKEFLDTQFKNGADGNLYKLELIYYPYTTVNGDVQAPKLPQPDNVLEVEIRDWGDDKENYRWIFLQENNAAQDDYSQLIALNKAFSMTGSSLETQTTRLMDLDEWMRALAFLSLTGTGDTYPWGYNHNFVIYFRPEDGKAMAFLFDMDFCYAQGYNYAILGANSANTYKICTQPNNKRRHYNHLLDLMTTTMNSTYLQPWAARYAGLLGQDWSSAVSYLQQRADFVRSSILAEAPLTTLFAISNNGGKDFGTSNPTVNLTGTAPLNVKEIQVNGTAYPVTWANMTTWNISVPLLLYTNHLVVRGIDSQGQAVANATDSIVITNLGPVRPMPVIINEWMADNEGPGGFINPRDLSYSDWFELYNPNHVAVELSGFYLTDDLAAPAQWPIPTNFWISPYGFLLVWADGKTHLNPPGGTDVDLHAPFNLSKSGEAIGLFDRDGVTPLSTITFAAQAANVSQGRFPDGDTNTVYWMTNWTPRMANRIDAPAIPMLNPITLTNGTGVTLSFNAEPLHTYRVDYKNELNAPAWTSLSTNTAQGAFIVIYDDLTGQPQRFYRVVLLP